MPYRDPTPYPLGARLPTIPTARLPRHMAIVMDDNGRWAKQQGLKRTEGYARDEAALLDVIHGALGIGIPCLSAYAFSTGNWKCPLEEMCWLMSFNCEVVHRHRDELDAVGARIRWAGRRPRLWGSVIRELEQVEQQGRYDTRPTLQLCASYGDRVEITNAAWGVACLTEAGKLDLNRLSGDHFRCFLDEPGIPDVDLFLCSSGEQRTSSLLLWQPAHMEFIFLDRLWPDSNRRNLWGAVEQCATHERRFGTA